MRKSRVNLPNRCYHLISRVAHRAFFLDDGERTRLVDLVRRGKCYAAGLETPGYVPPAYLRTTLGIASREYFTKAYLRPLTEAGLIAPRIRIIRIRRVRNTRSQRQGPSGSGGWRRYEIKCLLWQSRPFSIPSCGTRQNPWTTNARSNTPALFLFTLKDRFHAEFFHFPLDAIHTWSNA